MSVGTIESRLKEIFQEYGSGRTALLPCLEFVQSELGYVPEDIVRFLSNLMNISTVEIYSVLTFYGMLTEKKVGDFHFVVCNSLCCYLKGNKEIIETLEKELGISAGEKSSDGKFSLELVGCLGLCDGSPAMQVNGKSFTNLTVEKVKDIVKKIKEKGEV